MKKENDKLQIDYDSNWKWLIERHPEEFIRFFLAAIYPQIDFRFKPRLISASISKIGGSKTKKGSMIADIVLEVRLLDGKKRLLYIHVEVQGRNDPNFGWKMFRPFYFLKDKYGMEVTALAIFVSERVPANPGKYEYEFGDTKVVYTYPYYLIRDAKEKELLLSDNLFAIAVLACKHLLATKPDKFEDRLQLRFLLLDYIFNNYKEKDFDVETVSSLVSFVINLLILPDEDESRFENTFTEKYKKEPVMRIWSSQVLEAAERRNMAFFGTTIEEMKALVEKERAEKRAEKRKLAAEMRKAEVEMRKAEAAVEKQKAEAAVEKQKAEAEKQKAEAEKQKAEAERQKAVQKLYFDMKLSVAQIVESMELEKDYVMQILAAHQKKK